MADGTSFALPTPNPTTPWPSPTTTSALKLRFLPPLTTLVTRLMETTVSLMSSCEGSIRSLVFIRNFLAGPGPHDHRATPRSELQTRFPRRVRYCPNAAVIEKSTAIEHDALDALLDRSLGDGLANRFGALDVAAADALGQRPLERRIDGRCRDE